MPSLPNLLRAQLYRLAHMRLAIVYLALLTWASCASGGIFIPAGTDAAFQAMSIVGVAAILAGHFFGSDLESGAARNLIQSPDARRSYALAAVAFCLLASVALAVFSVAVHGVFALVVDDPCVWPGAAALVLWMFQIVLVAWGASCLAALWGVAAKNATLGALGGVFSWLPTQYFFTLSMLYDHPLGRRIAEFLYADGLFLIPGLLPDRSLSAYQGPGLLLALIMLAISVAALLLAAAKRDVNPHAS